ncbi:MAG: sugar kinase [Rectinemataceae bacterium]
MHIIDWMQVPNYQFGDDDVIATIGQDGLIANALKYLRRQTIIGFNSDVQRWDGVLAQFDPQKAEKAIGSCLNGTIRIKEITKAVVELSDSQELHAVNDFFVGVSNHSSARYTLTFRHAEEQHSSSGIVVSTPLGRSAWMRSILTGANNIMNRLQGKKQKIVESATSEKWDDDCLYFAVREPFPSVSSKTDIVFGKITRFDEFMIESRMGENGLIFSDGVQNDCLSFNYSVKARFGLAKEKGRLAVLS